MFFVVIALVFVVAAMLIVQMGETIRGYNSARGLANSAARHGTTLPPEFIRDMGPDGVNFNDPELKAEAEANVNDYLISVAPIGSTTIDDWLVSVNGADVEAINVTVNFTTKGWLPIFPTQSHSVTASSTLFHT